MINLKLQTLDLSYNEFINVPAGDLRQLVGLRTLNLSGNAFDRILDGDFVHPVLQVFFTFIMVYNTIFIIIL